MHGIAYLEGTVKNYDWGGFSFIPTLLNTDNESEIPQAEYWLGVHPQAACLVVDENNRVLLRDLLSEQGEELLGNYVSTKFGTMPFLLKALDVRNMLSIQVHPSKQDAEKSYRLENEAGIPLDAATRNYKDDNHKPELMVAMDDFWLLHGFRPADSMNMILQKVPELQFLLPVFANDAYQKLYRHVMEMPQQEVNQRLQPLIDRIVPLYQSNMLEKDDPVYWAAKGYLHFSQAGNIDRGIFSIFLFNLVKLTAGQAIFQDAGVPHAYLEGQNVEIMASSDNVLRGGLTTKHIDVPELLKHVRCEPTYPRILLGEIRNQEKIFHTPAPDFELSGFEIVREQDAGFEPVTSEILLLVRGRVEVRAAGKILVLAPGRPSAVAFPGNSVTLTGLESSMVFRASVPSRPW
jgi:mannose-6-phosphate isomerase